MKRNITAFILLFAVLLFGAVSASCGGEPVDPANSNTDTPAATAEETQTEAPETEPPTIYDELGTIDYGGYTYRILCGPMSYSKWLEGMVESELTGEIIFDAVYERNAAVGEAFNCEIKALPVTFSDIPSYAARSIAAGDPDFDLMMLRAEQAGTLTPNEYMVDFMTTGLDMDKPYYTRATNSVNTIGGKLYLAASEIMATSLANTYVVFYNTDLGNDFGFSASDVYNSVFDGKWTIDRMTAMTKGVYSDLDGDGAVSYYDRYGYALWDSAEAMTALQYSMGQGTATTDGKTVTLTINSPRMGTVIDKLNTMFHASNDNTMIAALRGEGEGVINVFTEGRALFATYIMMHAYLRMRDMEDVYAALPTPKLDESQDAYYTIGSSYFFAIPVTSSDVDRSANVFAALSYEGYNRIYPAFFETTMKAKFSADENTARLYDIISESRTVDFGYMYGSPTKILNVIQECLKTNSSDYASRYAAISESAVSYMNEMLESYK